MTNRSAKGGARSSLQYGGEGALIHPPHQGVCGRHGTEDQCVTLGDLGGSAAGRAFRDDLDLCEQLAEWTATVADVRVHGTTHERPVDRFARERDALVPAAAGRAFRLEAPLTRVVATDYLVSVDTKLYDRTADTVTVDEIERIVI